MKYKVVIRNNSKTVRRGFKTWEEAYEWALLNEWAYAKQNGLTVVPA